METSISDNNTPSEDWHRADIVAALRKAGWSLRRLSRYHGYEAGSLGQALKRETFGCVVFYPEGWINFYSSLYMYGWDW